MLSEIHAVTVENKPGGRMLWRALRR